MMLIISNLLRESMGAVRGESGQHLMLTCMTSVLYKDNKGKVKT